MTEYDLGKVVGDDGADGNGIASISKTGTSGLVDTYTITYDDGDSDTFTVTNGADGQTGATGNGIASVTKTGTSGLVDTYTILFTNGNSTTFTVTNGSDASVTIVTNFSGTTSDSKVPSEKLTKTELDKKISISSTTGLIKNDGTIDTTSYSTFSGSYSDLSNKPSIPSSSSDLSDGSDLVKKSNTSGLLKNDGSVDTNSYLTSSSLSNYVQKSNTSGLLKNDGTVDTTSYSTFSGSYSDLSNKPSIPSASSDLSDGSDLVKKSSTSGLLKNDGSVDTNSYLTTGSASSTYQTKLVSGTSIKTINNESLLGSGNITVGGGSSVDIVTAWESTPSDSKVPSEKLTKETINALNVFDIGQNNSFNAVCLSKDMDSDGQGMAFANAILIYNENNDKLYYDKNTNGDTDSGNELATMNDIPSLANYVQKSSTSGLLKNDGSIDTSSYITSSAISGMLTSSDIANNLTTTASGKVLDARQGKALADLIGDAITYINQ